MSIRKKIGPKQVLIPTIEPRAGHNRTKGRVCYLYLYSKDGKNQKFIEVIAVEQLYRSIRKCLRYVRTWNLFIVFAESK